MANWWDSMSLFSQVLCCIAVPATIILLIQTILSFIGMGDHGGFDHDIGGHDVGFDHDIGGHDCGFDHDIGDVHGDGIYGGNEAGGDHDPTGSYGLRIFTFRTVISFFAVFGWVGVVLDAAGLDHIISLSVAFVSGFAVMLLIAFLIFLSQNMLPHLSPIPDSEAVFIKKIRLEHSAVVEQEPSRGVLGDLLGCSGAVQDDLGQHAVRPSADPAVDVAADLSR